MAIKKTILYKKCGHIVTAYRSGSGSDIEQTIDDYCAPCGYGHPHSETPKVTTPKVAAPASSYRYEDDFEIDRTGMRRYSRRALAAVEKGICERDQIYDDDDDD